MSSRDVTSPSILSKNPEQDRDKHRAVQATSYRIGPLPTSWAALTRAHSPRCTTDIRVEGAPKNSHVHQSPRLSPPPPLSRTAYPVGTADGPQPRHVPDARYRRQVRLVHPVCDPTVTVKVTTPPGASQPPLHPLRSTGFSSELYPCTLCQRRSGDSGARAQLVEQKVVVTRFRYTTRCLSRPRTTHSTRWTTTL